MKKNARKLVLSKETFRHLQPGDVRRVVGGGFEPVAEATKSCEATCTEQGCNLLD